MHVSSQYLTDALGKLLHHPILWQLIHPLSHVIPLSVEQSIQKTAQQLSRIAQDGDKSGMKNDRDPPTRGMPKFFNFPGEIDGSLVMQTHTCV